MITIGFLELNSISKGILAADEMIKAADISLIMARPSCPGVLRGYAVAGVLGGMVFYDQTGSRLLFAVLKKCSGWIKMKRRGKKSQKTGKKRTTRGQAENMERK